MTSPSLTSGSGWEQPVVIVTHKHASAATHLSIGVVTLIAVRLMDKREGVPALPECVSDGRLVGVWQ